MARINNKDTSLYKEILQEIEDAKTGPAPQNFKSCQIYSTQRSADEPISGNKSTLEDLPIVIGADIKGLLNSFWVKLQAELISEQKARAKMVDMFKELICVSANEVLSALVTRKSLYECSPGEVQVSQTGVRGSLSPTFRTVIRTTSTEELIALDRVIKLLCTEVTRTVNSVLKNNCGFETFLLVEEKDYSTPQSTLHHIAAHAPMFLPVMTFSDQWDRLIEDELSKGLTENDLKSEVLDSENQGTEDSTSEQERVMSEFSERNPSTSRPHGSEEPLGEEEQMKTEQEKCDILSLGEIMLQIESPGVPHNETETQFKTEQTSSCEPAQNQEPALLRILNQELALLSSLNQEPALLSSLNQGPAPQSSLNQGPAPLSSLTKRGSKKQRKQKPAKDLQSGLEEEKTPIKTLPQQGKIKIRYDSPSKERGRSPPTAIRYYLPPDAPFMPLHLIPDQIIRNHERPSEWETSHISYLAWLVYQHILEDKRLPLTHSLVTKLSKRLEEHLWEWNVKVSPNDIKVIACDIYRGLCSKSTKILEFSSLTQEDGMDHILTEIHKHLVRTKKRSRLHSFFHSIRHALCRYC